jgi:hypothetical protein
LLPTLILPPYIMSITTGRKIGVLNKDNGYCEFTLFDCSAIL